MTAAAVLAIGILGAMQALLLASQQNAIASRMTRAAEIADQVRQGLDSQRYGGLVAAGKVIDIPGRCSGAAAVLALADGLDTMPVVAPMTGPCVIDLDAYEATALPGDLIAPGYALVDGVPTTREDGDIYRRVLVVTTVPDTASAQTNLVTATVVVSFRAGFRRIAVRQTSAFYNPAVNRSGVDI
ncbi:MAG TPA: prepilin cleavage protein [Myxococcaceae bacterium]|jgi:hypothetical protein